MCRVPFPSVTLDSGWDNSTNSVARWGGARANECVCDTKKRDRKPGGVEAESGVAWLVNRSCTILTSKAGRKHERGIVKVDQVGGKSVEPGGFGFLGIQWCNENPLR